MERYKDDSGLRRPGHLWMPRSLVEHGGLSITYWMLSLAVSRSSSHWISGNLNTSSSACGSLPFSAYQGEPPIPKPHNSCTKIQISISHSIDLLNCAATDLRTESQCGSTIESSCLVSAPSLPCLLTVHKNLTTVSRSLTPISHPSMSLPPLLTCFHLLAAIRRGKKMMKTRTSASTMLNTRIILTAMTSRASSKRSMTRTCLWRSPCLGNRLPLMGTKTARYLQHPHRPQAPASVHQPALPIPSKQP